VFGSDRRYWSKAKKTALAMVDVAGFPYQLSLMKTKTALAIPVVVFTKAVPGLKKIFNQPLNIYVTPDAFFVTKFREIFQQIKLMQALHCGRIKALAWRAPHRILATITKLCHFLCDTTMRDS